MKPIYPVKTQKPALSDIFIRQRLFQLIDDYSDKKIYWVSGPGGAGKTTLINSFVDKRNVPCIWYQVDESDQDVAGFFHYLGLAGNVAAANHEIRFPNFTAEYMFGLREFSRNFFAELFQIQQPGTYLVLDNCQEVPDDAELFDAILSGMSRMGAGSRIIFISRNELPTSFSRLRAYNELGIIGANELRLTIDELEAFSNLKKLKLKAEQLQKFHHQLDGWAAGFQIITGAAGLKDQIDISPGSFWEDSKEIIFHYFAETIFQHLDKSSQKTLLIASLLPYIDTSLLGGMDNIAGAPDIMKELCRTNTFITKQTGLPGIYNFHQLFREFLANRCKQVLSAEDIQELRLTAAELYTTQGKTEEGISLNIQAENWPAVISLISKHGPILLRQGRFRTLGKWLQCFPEMIAATEPWVLYWSAMCLMLQAPDKAQKLFDQALKIFEENDDVVGMFLTLSGMGESLAYRFDTFVLYDQWIEALELLLEKYPDFPSTEIESRITLVMLTAIALRQPSYSHADDWRNRALGLMNRGKELEDSIRIHILNTLILERTLTGHLNDAEVLISSFKNSIADQDVPPAVIINLKNFEALHSWRSGNSSKCIEAASEGLALAEKSGVHIISFILLVNRAVGALVDGNLNQADISLGSLESQLDQAGSYGKLLYHFTKAWRYLTDNQWNEALAQSRHALKFAPSVGNPEASAVSHLAHSIALRASGEIEHAESELEKALEFCQSYPLHQIAFGCYLTKADVYFSSGNEEHGRAALRKGLSIGSELGYTMFPLWTDDTVSKLCVRALESGIHEAYVQRLVKQRKLRPARPPVELENWPWELKIYCLGCFKIIVDGEILRFKKKTQQKPLELLKVLISRGGRNVSESHISDMLWPDADGDMQRQSFNTTLHRLRKILKVDDILLLNAGVLNLNEEKCWTDVWAFQHLVSESDTLNQYNEITSPGHIKARRAINHYQGSFLPYEDESWVIAPREKLHGHYLMLIEGLTKQFTNSNQWQEAIDLYEKGLEAEPTTAHFYYQLMQCHSQLGHTASALNVHSRYLKKFGADRSQVFHGIQALYQKINGITNA